MLEYLPLTAVQFWGAVQIGLIFSIVTLGIYISFRILDFPDLTVNGTFPMGAGIAAVLILNGENPWFACLVAMVGGACAGFVTAWLNTRWKILHLLASILTMTALYSINLRIMGAPNLALFSLETIFTPFEKWGLSSVFTTIFLVGLLTLFILGLLTRFLLSEIGLGMRATGKNQRMAVANGVHVNAMTLAGLSLSNALVALAGAIYVQAMNFADISLGNDVIIVGLAAVLIGEAVIPGRYILCALISCVVGSIVYRWVIALALNGDFLGLQASDQQLVNATLIGLAMILSKTKNPLKALKNRGAQS